MSTDVQQGAINAIKQYVEGLLAEEGITPEILDYVDLSIADSPVIAFRGESLDRAVETIKTVGGGYIVRHPLLEAHGTHSADAIKVMRCRYLLALKEQQRRQFAPLIAKLQGLKS